jgi:hypothetical protein
VLVYKPTGVQQTFPLQQRKNAPLLLYRVISLPNMFTFLLMQRVNPHAGSTPWQGHLS